MQQAVPQGMFGGTSNEFLTLRQEWSGFDLIKVGSDGPIVQRRGDLVVISGCITTVSPMKNQAGWDLTIGWVGAHAIPTRDIAFLSPTQLSRYEGVYQNVTSTVLKSDGKLTIHFQKNMNPMVLHMTGLAFSLSLDRIEIPIATYESREWTSQQKRKPKDVIPGQSQAQDDLEPCFESDENRPLSAVRWKNFVFLTGELQDASYPAESRRIAVLPPGLRPHRVVRCLGLLLNVPGKSNQPNNAQCDRVIEHSVALTIRPGGEISVQGGKVQMVDNKGHTRLLQQRKKGRLCFDGVRFAVCDGTPVTLAKHIAPVNQKEGAQAKLGYLFDDQDENTATVVRQDDVVLLDGHLAWSSQKALNPRQPVGLLPQGCRPRNRQTFFTRGGSDLEEKRRVDIDVHGRIFCPEGMANNRVELTGILFIASTETPRPLRGPDAEWDELKLHYHQKEATVISTSFDGRELLEQFVGRCNHHEWKLIEFDFGRHASRKMLLPLGHVKLQGHERWDSMNLGPRGERLWKQCHSSLSAKAGITTFQTLLHLSTEEFQKLANEIGLCDADKQTVLDKHNELRRRCEYERNKYGIFTSAMAIEEMATQIVDQMFEHWDFRAQLQGALQNDFRAPQTIEHLFPSKKSGAEWLVKKRIKEHDMKKFEEIRQFFYLYETTGSNMTHCCLMGSQDFFTTTGKWHFPDAPDVQDQLFANIAWLFERQVYCYMVERQTPRFPFIEDLDIQASADWDGVKVNPKPPDELIMNLPNDQVGGDPGEFMRRRAMAVHMIYPQLDHIEIYVYSASGYNKGKDLLKTSFHLVFPQLIVDPDRAPVIRHATLGLFHRETAKKNSFLQILQDKLLRLHESNTWELVFDNTTIHARNGLRMPYNDKGSSVIESEREQKLVKEGKMSKNKAQKKRVREDRPSVAVGRLRFEFGKDEAGADCITRAFWDRHRGSMSTNDWIKYGTCRRDPNNLPDLTEWRLAKEVIEMLPTKPGESFFPEGEADGEGGHWVTHKPLPLVRRFVGTTAEFVKQFNQFYKDELDALQDDGETHLVEKIIGTFVHISAQQAIWRTMSSAQCENKVPDPFWGTRRMQRPAEVIYVQKKGKVLVDGPKDSVEALLRALRNISKTDDNAIMPIYDLNKISGL